MSLHSAAGFAVRVLCVGKPMLQLTPGAWSDRREGLGGARFAADLPENGAH